MPAYLRRFSLREDQESSALLEKMIRFAIFRFLLAPYERSRIYSSQFKVRKVIAFGITQQVSMYRHR